MSDADEVIRAARAVDGEAAIVKKGWERWDRRSRDEALWERLDQLHDALDKYLAAKADRGRQGSATRSATSGSPNTQTTTR